MRKSLAVLLITMMFFGMCACEKQLGTEEEEMATFQVGFGRADITPEDSVP